MESVKLPNGESLGVPRRYIPNESNKDEKPNPEQVNSRILHDIVKNAYNNIDLKEGKLKAKEGKDCHRDMLI